MNTLHFENTEYGVRLFDGDGHPVMILKSGELHNSSSTSREYLKSVWKPLRDLGLDCVIASVQWDLFEPEEGKFDYSIPDYLITDAEKNGLKLILIWFASWKNAGSYYVPDWVQESPDRFPRAEDDCGRRILSLSCFHESNRNADARAFAALMKYIAERDTNGTVLMMQVENECGHLDTSRDFCTEAEKRFVEPVPRELSEYLVKHGKHLSPFLRRQLDENGNPENWKAMFGQAADECFMGYHLAKYIGCVVREGKKYRNIPMFVNGWMFQSDDQPAGKHPCGGPVPEINDIWHCAAPEIDAVAPDLYLMPRFERNCAETLRPEGKPLLIPEMHVNHYAPASLLCAAGRDALCVSPFGIDDLARAYSADPSAEVACLVRNAYRILDAAGDILFHTAPKDKLGFVQQNGMCADYAIGDVRFNMEYLNPVGGNTAPGGGFIVRIRENEFVIAAINVWIHVSRESVRSYEIVFHDEWIPENGRFVRGRRLCGDELELYFSNEISVAHVRFFPID